MDRREFMGMVGAAGASMAFPRMAWAQSNYPNRPVRLVVPSAPGGATDLLGRVTADGLAARWPQPVVVENRAGAGTSIGARYVSQAAGDGYTLLLNGISSHAINPAVYKNIGYDPIKDFTPITLVATLPNLILVRPDYQASNLKELLELSRKSEKNTLYATPGNGTSPHLSGELLAQISGASLEHVSYGSSARALNDLMGGQIDIVIDNISGAIPFIKAGRLKALGVTTSTRSVILPDVPTFAESGVEGYDLTSWAGLVGPAGIPADIVKKINADATAMLKDEKSVERFMGIGATAHPMSPEAFGQFYAEQGEKFRKIAKQANLQLS